MSCRCERPGWIGVGGHDQGCPYLDGETPWFEKVIADLQRENARLLGLLGKENATDQRSDEARRAAIAKIRASGVCVGQRYQHHRTRGVYTVIAVSLFEPNLTPLVHYRTAEDEFVTPWTRTLDNFCETIGVVPEGTGTVEIKRFALLD